MNQKEAVPIISERERQDWEKRDDYIAPFYGLHGRLEREEAEKYLWANGQFTLRPVRASIRCYESIIL